METFVPNAIVPSNDMGSSSSSNSKFKSKSTNNNGTIAIVIVLLLICVAVGALLAVLMIKKRRRRREQATADLYAGNTLVEMPTAASSVGSSDVGHYHASVMHCQTYGDIPKKNTNIGYDDSFLRSEQAPSEAEYT